MKEQQSEIEQPYFDKHGKEIKEFAVLKVFHFKGVNEQGRGRKNYYMYKWVQLRHFIEGGMKYWVAIHLVNGSGDYYHLRSGTGENRILHDVEIVQ
jgi:hypothetical protein